MHLTRAWPPWRRLVAILPLLTFLMGAVLQGGAAAAESASTAGPAIYVVKAEQTVENGLASFLERAYAEAEDARAEQVILILNTFGGRVDSAEAIGHLVRTSKVKTTAFVQGKAVSAGTYIALNAQSLVMQSGSTIGAAAVVNGAGDLIDNPKTISFWTSEMMESARLAGRDPQIAAAMVDPGMKLTLSDINKEKKAGEILTLTASEALKVGYADYTAETLDDVLAHNQWENRAVVEVTPSFFERVAQFLTLPAIMTLLLLIGIAGIAIELFVPGFGFPGIIGALAFALYFFGHYVAGFAGMEDVVLFIVGIVLLISEVFVPSFGILGFLGTAAIIAGVLMASADIETALTSLFIALVAAAILVFFIVRRFKHKGVWNRFILEDRLTSEEGYVSNVSRVDLIGRSGETLTPLRPSGTALIDGARIDVVTAGDFIGAGERIVVVKVEGTRVVVAADSKSALL